MKFDSMSIAALKSIFIAFAENITGKFDYKEIVSAHTNNVSYNFVVQKNSIYNLSIEKSFVSQIRLNPIEKPLNISALLIGKRSPELFVRKADFFERILLRNKIQTSNISINKTFYIKSSENKICDRIFSENIISNYFIKNEPELIINSLNDGISIEMRVYNQVNLELLIETYDSFKTIINILENIN